MTRCLWVAAFLVLTCGYATAAEQGKEQGTKSSESGSSTKRRSKSKEPAAPQVDKAALSRVHQAKSVYMFAVESCDRSPERCDKALKNDAEQRFLDTCGTCAPADRCKADRDEIKKGAGRASRNPCAQ